ncbi:MAG: TIGR01212 family radical SAM protein [Humidesulfovibrio sp.]|nr:TIGR01212 family radical SAM protein [Humidesulfovibrio sp.]
MFFSARVGGRVRKVPLDAGFSCPNRDGTLSRAGCSFCNAEGSGTGLYAQGLGLAAQWAALLPRVLVKDPRARLLAYLQAYSNTHTSPERLRAVLDEVAVLPGVAGLCLGTRPDCLDLGAGEARLDVLGAFVGRGLPFIQLDLGLQSADDAVLARAGRGHDAACFAEAVRAAAARGLCVCAHLLHGLPGARPDDLARSVDFLNTLPVAAVKFHNLLICRGTALARLWEAGRFVPAGREDYAAALIEALERLRPDICVQRLIADPAPGELLAPAWTVDKYGALDCVRREMVRRNTWQGRLGFCPEGSPDWTLYYKEDG